MLELATASLQDASSILSEVRTLLLQGMNGTMNDDDRETLGNRVGQLLEQLVDIANVKLGDQKIFGGTAGGTQAYSVDTTSGVPQIVYQGDDGVQKVEIGFGADVAINMPGSQVFDLFEFSGVGLSGLSGLTLGTSANEGTGFAELDVRHDATVGAPGSGLALVGGGAGDTILGDHTLVVDAAAGTVRLDGGEPRPIPAPGAADEADFVVTDENGAELHLDFTGYAGTSSTTTLTGEGSVSLDGSTYQPLTFMEGDLELVDEDRGIVLHLDDSSVRRAGKELVGFNGATSVFEVVQGIAQDLANPDGMPVADLVDRLQMRATELERTHDNLLVALGTLGARTERIQTGSDRLEAIRVNLEGVLSKNEDADLSEVILEMTRSEQTLQLAQATGSRLIQNTLLNFLR